MAHMLFDNNLGRQQRRWPIRPSSASRLAPAQRLSTDPTVPADRDRCIPSNRPCGGGVELFSTYQPPALHSLRISAACSAAQEFLLMFWVSREQFNYKTDWSIWLASAARKMDSSFGFHVACLMKACCRADWRRVAPLRNFSFIFGAPATGITAWLHFISGGAQRRHRHFSPASCPLIAHHRAAALCAAPKFYSIFGLRQTGLTRLSIIKPAWTGGA
ncbi:hypothetical protein C8R43DRAFT_97658 [Mycena crocata]|nr:hypothetical protein C8R43DRAFT_97658 [Mycena crocata]